MRKPTPPKENQIEFKQTELKKLLIEYAKTKTPNPKIKQLQSEIDYFHYGLKI